MGGPLKTGPSAGAVLAALPAPGAGRDAMAAARRCSSSTGLEGMTDVDPGPSWSTARPRPRSSWSCTTRRRSRPGSLSIEPARRGRPDPRACRLTVLEYETRGREVLRRAGLTGPVLDTAEYLQGLMGRDVSLAELQDRLQNGLLKVTAGSARGPHAFTTYFGTDGDVALAQLFLDPNVAAPELEKRAMTAYAGGVGSRFGVTIAQGIAREIADTGVSDAAIWQGFKQAGLDACPVRGVHLRADRSHRSRRRSRRGVRNAVLVPSRRWSERVAPVRPSSPVVAVRWRPSGEGVVGLGIADS